MRFLSLCSGIEAASVAWAPMGWKAAAVAEIEAFPSAVLAHHYPDVPNLGDITKFKEWPDLGTIDLICGGTPCQSFSIAGLRKGLADPRGNLSLTFLAIVDRYRPRYVVWENVPGVLSSDGGRDFAAFLGGLGQLGYGWAFRVLDAQHVRVDGFPRAVPQRRRRVFVVGYLGDWRRAAAVLSEPESVLGNSPPRREAREGIAAGALAGTSPGGGWRVGADEAAAGQLVAFGGNNCSGPIEAAASLAAHGGPAGRMDFASETFVCAPPLTSKPYGDHESQEGLLVAHSLRAEGFDASEDGTGRGTPLVPVAYGLSTQQEPKWGEDVSPTLALPSKTGGGQVTAVAFDTTQITSKANYSQPKKGDPCHPLAAGAHPPAIAIQERAISDNPAAGPDGVGVRQDGAAYTLEARQVPQAVAFQERGREDGRSLEIGGDVAFALTAPSGGGRAQERNVLAGWAVRRLMPVECERLQGFPDGYTDIPYRGKPAADGPRYKALGNSWAVNVARWVGRRIEMVEQIAADLEEERAA